MKFSTRLTTKKLTRYFLFCPLLLSVWLVGCSSDDADELIDLLTVASGDVSSINITGGSEIISVAATTAFTLAAITGDGTASATDLTNSATWTSSDNAIATVSNTGVVTGLADGTVAISATFGNLSDSTSVQVSSAALTSIEIIAPSTSINECGSLQLAASGIFAGEEGTRDITNDVIWTVVEDNAVAVTDVPGLITSNNSGLINVQASLDGETATEELDVLQNLAAIVINAPPDELIVDDPLQYTATASFSDAAPDVDITNNVIWDIVDDAATDFAGVTDTGVVTASEIGDGVLTASCGSVPAAQLNIASVSDGNSDILQIDITFINGVPVEDPLPIDFVGDEIEIQFEAIATLIDGSTLNLTENNDTDWVTVSSTTDLLFLDNSDGDMGELTISGTGNIDIQVQFIDDDNDDQLFTSDLEIDVF